MKHHLILFPLASLICLGCGDNSMSQAEARKTSPPMTDADRAKMAAGMAEGAEKRRASQSAWAEKNPAEVARINAERAAMGRAPLGGK